MASPLQTNLIKIQKTLSQFNDWVNAMYRHKEYDYNPLPYIPLEYIQSSGTQYINTEVYSASPLGFEIDFQLTSTASSKAYFGYRTSGTTGRFSLANYDGFHMMIGNGNIWNYAIDTVRHKCSVKVNASYSYTWTWDSKSGSGSTNSNMLGSGSVPFYLFYNGINWDNIDGRASMKLYSAKMYNSSGTLIRDLIPVKDLDGVVCMYDLLNEKFYYNAGTGTFIAGGEI